MRVVIFFVFFFFSALSFARTTDDGWYVGIGDPTVLGWLTVVFYLVAMYLSFKQFRQLKAIGGVSKFWLYLAVMLLLLSINKQLDLQTLLTQTLREHALANGWYAQRRFLQAFFILFLGLGMLLTLFSLRVLLAKSWRQYKLAWVGVLLLCGFVLMRAASFHHFDLFIDKQLLGVRINVVLEIGALAIIIVAALKHYDVQLMEGGAMQAKVGAKTYVEIESEHDLVICPQCYSTPASSPAHGRLFKCKQCGHQYTLFITSY